MIESYEKRIANLETQIKRIPEYRPPPVDLTKIKFTPENLIDRVELIHNEPKH
jgi:hypothetical protein